MERIALARKYRVVEWLRDAYLELIQKKTLNFEELLRPPADPDSNCTDRNWEEDAKKWETLARISQVQIKVAVSFDGGHYRCCGCNTSYGGSYPNGHLCKCRLLRLVNEAFREEFESLREDTEHVEHPLPRKLPICHFLCPLKKLILYSQQDRFRVGHGKTPYI